MAADITINMYKLRIISAYAPTEDKPLSTKEAFYRDLQKLCQVPRKTKLLIQGDFNATSTRHSRFDGLKANEWRYKATDKSNDNGQIFLEFCRLSGLSILNTWFDHPLKHRYTWHSPDKVTKKVIDYSLSDSFTRQYVYNTRVRNSYLESDHRILITYLKTPANKAARYRKYKKKASPKPDINKLKDPDVKNIFKEEMTNQIIQYERSHTLNKKQDIIISSLSKARETLPKQKRNKKQHPCDDDGELKLLVQERENIKRNSGLNKHKIKEISSRIRKKVRKLRNSYYSKIASEISEAQQHRQ